MFWCSVLAKDVISIGSCLAIVVGGSARARLCTGLMLVCSCVWAMGENDRVCERYGENEEADRVRLV